MGFQEPGFWRILLERFWGSVKGDFFFSFTSCVREPSPGGNGCRTPPANRPVLKNNAAIVNFFMLRPPHGKFGLGILKKEEVNPNGVR